MSGDGPSPPPPDSHPPTVEQRRARAALLSHMRHDLRTPVNAILGYSEMLIEDATGSAWDTLRDDLTRIHRAGGTLLALINEILDPAKVGEGDVDLEAFGARARHDLRTPVNAIIGYSELLLEEVVDGALADATADLTRIRDSGRKLLGLIDDIVHLSEIEAGKRELDLGATPVSDMIQEAVSVIRPLASGSAPAAAGERGRILVVDDNEINRDMLLRRLTREGYAVGTAENGRQALDLLATQPFDLVLLDILMPEINGFEVLARLKADEALRHIPVIMISALDEIDSVVRCIEIGAEDFLPKPFNPILLRARIGACLEKKYLRDREVLHLKQIEEEKRRADELLHVILPHEIVEELKASNAVRPRRYENVAVLFCDIVGFTPYCAGREPEEVVAYLQELVEAYEELALKCGLQKIKTIGDSFMATAGAIRPTPTPGLDAVRCGLAMVETARRLGARWEVRVGIHVGPVMAGVVGHRQYLFDLWGDTVNTAARVESHGKNGAVNVSASAWDQIKSDVVGVSLGPIRLKGIGEMEIFRVDGLRVNARSA
jgi:adenylate cyclase